MYDGELSHNTATSTTLDTYFQAIVKLYRVVVAYNNNGGVTAGYISNVACVNVSVLHNAGYGVGLLNTAATLSMNEYCILANIRNSLEWWTRTVDRVFNGVLKAVPCFDKTLFPGSRLLIDVEPGLYLTDTDVVTSIVLGNITFPVTPPRTLPFTFDVPSLSFDTSYPIRVNTSKYAFETLESYNWKSSSSPCCTYPVVSVSAPTPPYYIVNADPYTVYV